VARSPRVCLVAIKSPISGQALGESLYALKGPFPALIAPDLKITFTRYTDGNLIAFLQLKRFDHRRGNANGETVSPLRNLHCRPPDIQWKEYIMANGDTSRTVKLPVFSFAYAARFSLSKFPPGLLRQVRGL